MTHDDRAGSQPIQDKGCVPLVVRQLCVKRVYRTQDERVAEAGEGAAHAGGEEGGAGTVEAWCRKKAVIGTGIAFLELGCGGSRVRIGIRLGIGLKVPFRARG